MPNLLWTFNRLRAMGHREVGYRMNQYLRSQVQRAGIGLATAVTPVGATGNSWLSVLPSAFDPKPYRDEAERILSGHFLLFGTHDAALGFPPDWNADPKTRKQAPLKFGKTLNYRDDQIVGDIKYLWEINRHLEIVVLAQAWRLTSDLRYAHGCRSLVESWIEQCPYPFGPNWTSSLELALRMLNWSCAWHLLGGDNSPLFSSDSGKGFKSRWLAAVRQHCHFVANHLSRYSSANNHLLGELLGLFVGATTWPFWPESSQWKRAARQEFEVQALMQNGEDGVNKEQAIWYHHEVADMMLLAGLTARALQCDFGPQFWARLEAMLEFIASIMDIGGQVPQLGDSDDAVIVRFCPRRDFCVYRSLLATGAVLFRRAEFKFKATAFDDKSRWLLGDAAAAKFAAIAAGGAPRPLRRSFEISGYYIFGANLETAREVRVLADAGPLGYLALAAHGHADALSFTLSIAGSQMLVDPGTYCYHSQQGWRAYFRGTSAHNTLRVDREDQSVFAGNFQWLHHANARCTSFESNAQFDRFAGEHDGYMRLPDPVKHAREITYNRAIAVLKIIDSVTCMSRHYIEIFWHFSPECIVTLQDELVTVRNRAITVRLRCPAALRVQIVRGSSAPYLGWISQWFDKMVPASTVIACGHIEGDWRGESDMTISFGSE
jgi:hypothetical protein